MNPSQSRVHFNLGMHFLSFCLSFLPLAFPPISNGPPTNERACSQKRKGPCTWCMLGKMSTKLASNLTGGWGWGKGWTITHTGFYLLSGLSTVSEAILWSLCQIWNEAGFGVDNGEIGSAHIGKSDILWTTFKRRSKEQPSHWTKIPAMM